MIGFAWLLIRKPELRRGMHSLLLRLLFPERWALPGNARQSSRRPLGALVDIVIGIAAVTSLFPYVRKKAVAFGGGWLAFNRGLKMTVTVSVLLAIAGILLDTTSNARYAAVRNPGYTPVSMEEEGGGPQSPFWPSSAKTNVGGLIPSDFFLDSEKCGECHKDIYEQWRASAHHFSSLQQPVLPPFDRADAGTLGHQGKPVVRQLPRSCHVLQRPLRQAGRRTDRYSSKRRRASACVSCHSIVHVEGSMGNGGFTIRYPGAPRLWHRATIRGSRGSIASSRLPNRNRTAARS